MGDRETASRLLAEIYANAQSSVLRLQCLELIHPAFNVEGMPLGRIRIVNHQRVPVKVVLENGDAATFLPGPYSVKRAAKSTNGRRDIQLVMDALTADGVAQLENVAKHQGRQRIMAVVREYAENNLDYPGKVDDRLTVINPTVSGTQIQASMVFNDTINKTIPSILYTLDSHPGLVI